MNMEIKGKFNLAKLFIDECDKETFNQIQLLCDQEFVKDSKIRIMPDAHAGAGCVIGTTMTISDKIVPNLVGVDIGCGVLATKLNLNKSDINLVKLDKFICNKIPSGFDIYGNDKVYDKYCNFIDLNKIKAPFNLKRAKYSLGTLGGGNHFIEIDEDKEGYLWLLIHTGSRHFGLEICNYYQNLGYTLLLNKGINTNKNLSYIEKENLEYYLNDMDIVQQYAAYNRKAIRDLILIKLNLDRDIKILDSFDTIHNYIDINNKILRKGSVSAQLNEKLIIPMNMRDGSLICIGKGNEDWNYSAPHGAGRILSRREALKILELEEFQNTMRDIYSTSVCVSTLDESPMAYKPFKTIIKSIGDTVEIKDRIIPIYNFKAH